MPDDGDGRRLAPAMRLAIEVGVGVGVGVGALVGVPLGNLTLGRVVGVAGAIAIAPVFRRTAP
jgi:hypothetical protein